MKFFIMLILLIALSASGIWGYLALTYPETATKQSAIYFAEHLIHPHKRLSTDVLGFLPYWEVDEKDSVGLDVLTEVNYFGLTVDGTGEIIDATDTQTEPGFREWDTQEMKDFVTKAHIWGTKVSLSIVCQDNTDIQAILDSTNAQETVIEQINEQITTRKLDGINIDFEYLGEPDITYQEKFTNFSKRLSTKLKAEHPKLKLSISIMPRAARDQDLFDFAKLAPLYDAFIGMSYDYYGASADVAGPGAPMKGFTEGKYFFDVETTYADYLKFIPKEKIIMGVPYYGWDRTVTDKDIIMSSTYPTDNANNYAAIISYSRMKKENSKQTYQCSWEPVAQETWCSYIDLETDLPHHVWLSDEKSIGIRFAFAKKQQFQGVAIWNLGYDTGYNDLYSLITKTFSN